LRLIATLAAENIRFADDPSNRDPRFTRPRLRMLMPTLAEEGLDAWRLARLAERVARAEEALGETGSRAFAALAKSDKGQITFPATDLMRLPAEIFLRLLARAIGELGDEGPVELGKLETLHSALVEAFRTRGRFRRSLAGAVVTLKGASLSVERAPPRRSRRLTTVRTGPRERLKKR
jgi:tRNA(Ile)-lysidine synthase